MSSRLRVIIDDEALLATVAVSRGPATSGEALEAALASAGVTVGIDPERFSSLLALLVDPDFQCDGWPLAQGRPARCARDATLEFVMSQGLQAGHVRDDGTVDYHDREFFKVVDSGELLAILHPAEPGVPGQRVDGCPIVPKPPQELSVRLLSGVAMGAQGEIRATRSGVVLYVPGKSLDVVDHGTHESNVDMHSGDLYVLGSLVVRGDVLHPFKVVVSGDLDIQGGVDVAKVVCGGALRIARGIRGGEGSMIHAGGNLNAHHAQSASLCAGGLLTVGEAVNCHLVGAEIRVSGRLRGGLVEAESRIVVHEVGAPSGTPTELVAAKPLELPIDEAGKLIAAQKAGPKSQQSTGRGTASRAATPESHGADYHLASGPRSATSTELLHLAQIEHRREELLRHATIEVGLAHPGVTLKIGLAHLTLRETVHSLRYHYDHESQSLFAAKL